MLKLRVLQQNCKLKKFALSFKRLIAAQIFLKSILKNNKIKKNTLYLYTM